MISKNMYILLSIKNIYTAINTWSKARKDEYHLRQYKNLNELQVE